LENARLWEQEDLYRKALEREFEIGRQIQAGFLPDSIPQPRGWEIAAVLKPAREVAGDFYDVFRLPHGRIGLVIADVCDKGLGAALFMTLFRSLIRAASNIGFHERKDIQIRKTTADHLLNALSFTNNYIHQTHGRTSMFATIFYGILDLHDGVLTYINAGHLPPMLVARTGIVSHLRPTGPAVGVIPDTHYKINKILLQPGDTLFSYTDGVTDTAKFTGETLNLDALLPYINQDNSLQRILDKIQDEIETFAESVKQIDDITMLAVRRKQTEKNGHSSDGR
jgi:sigma-B regulation protein RsbU (phosphoserine phosphatase)